MLHLGLIFVSLGKLRKYTKTFVLTEGTRTHVVKKLTTFYFILDDQYTLRHKLSMSTLTNKNLWINGKRPSLKSCGNIYLHS